MMRAGGLEAEADEDYDDAIAPAHAIVAPPLNAAQGRAVAFANAGHPLRVAQRLLSKKRTDVIVGANGDQWVKHKLSRNGAKQYWRCRDHHMCHVRGWSDVGTTVIHRTDPAVLHTHDQSPIAQAARNLQDAVRAKALQDRDASTSAVVDSVVRGLPNDIAERYRRGNLMRVANNAKRDNGAAFVNRPVADMEFNEAYSTTAAGEEFLLYDSRRTEPGLAPFLIFASATGIQSLREANDWGSDGTFSVAPPQFDSLYTVHAMRDDHSAVCAAYMLLPDRKKETYIRALSALIREAHLEDAAPTTIMADFEAGPISAWTTVFPGVRIRGCLFHYTQALWRNLASKGLTLLYQGNNKAKVLLRCFGAMAFVHPNDVVEAFDAIVAALRTCTANGEIDAAFDDAIQNYCDYVRDNYVRRRDRQGVWQSPRVANVGQWNCHYATLQGFHRTNNAIEAWNRQFAELFARAHCAMDKYIYRMQTDEDRTRQALRRLQLHPNEPLRRGRRPQHVATDDALREQVERYDEYRDGGRLLEFMRAVQYHLGSARFPNEAPANDNANIAGNAAPPPAPALPDVDAAPQQVPQRQAAAAPPGRARPAGAPRAAPAQAAAPPPGRAQVDAPPPGRAPAAAPPPGRAPAAALPPGRAQVAAPPPGRAPAAALPPVRAQPVVAHPQRAALGIAHTGASVPFGLPRRILVDVRRSANHEQASVQSRAQAVAADQLQGPSHNARPLQVLAEAAAVHRANEERGSAGPSNTRKRLAGVVPPAAPPKKQAVQRKASQKHAEQEEEFQLPSQFSQKATASQPLGAIDNNTGSAVGRRAGRGSRMADMIRRLS